MKLRYSRLDLLVRQVLLNLSIHTLNIVVIKELDIFYLPGKRDVREPMGPDEMYLRLPGALSTFIATFSSYRYTRT